MAGTNGNGNKIYAAIIGGSATLVSVLFVILMSMIASVNTKLDIIMKEQGAISSRVSVCETKIFDHDRRIDRVESIKLVNP